MGKETPITEVTPIEITSEYIALGQFLKLADIVSSGAEAKGYILSHDILVNDEAENRRGRKLRSGDRIVIEGAAFAIVAKR